MKGKRKRTKSSQRNLEGKKMIRKGRFWKDLNGEGLK